MALKDWKKTRSDKYRQVWRNNNSKRIVSIEFSDSPTELKWVVFSGIENSYIDINKYFKSKSQALSYAKKYMRDN